MTNETPGAMFVSHVEVMETVDEQTKWNIYAWIGKSVLNNVRYPEPKSVLILTPMQRTAVNALVRDATKHIPVLPVKKKRWIK